MFSYIQLCSCITSTSPRHVVLDDARAGLSETQGEKRA